MASLWYTEGYDPVFSNVPKTEQTNFMNENLRIPWYIPQTDRFRRYDTPSGLVYPSGKPCDVHC